MKQYNFDEIIERRGSGDVKHSAQKMYFGRDDLLGLWVADMDFATPPFIIEALRKRLEHPILGYSVMPDDYWSAVTDWVQARHGWTLRPEWLRFIPGIVKGIGMVVNVFTRPGDKVIVQPPVYHPFHLVPRGNGRQVAWNPLREENGTYRMDFDQLDEICDESCRLLILSNPHNPAGICWDRESLRQLARFCSEHRILVVSDEIH